MRIFRKALLSLSLILFYANNAYATTTGTYPVEENTGSGKIALLLVAIGLVVLVLFIGYKMDKNEAQEKRKEKIIKKRNKNDEDDVYSNIYNSHEETDEYEEKYEEYKSVSEETAVVENVYPNLNTEMETGYEEELLKEIEKAESNSNGLDDVDDLDKTAVIEKIDFSKFDNDESLSSGSFEEEYEEVEEDADLEEVEELEDEDAEEDFEDEEIEEDIEEYEEEEELEEEDSDELEEDDFEEVVETDFNKKYKIIDADDIDVYDNYEANYYDYESPYDSTMVFNAAPVKKEPNILEKFSDVKGYDFNENDREFLDLEKIVTDANVKKFTRKKDNKVKAKKVEQEPENVEVIISKKYTRKKAEKIAEEVLEEKPKRGRKPAAKKEEKEKKPRRASTKKTEKTLEEKPKRGRKPAAKKETTGKENKSTKTPTEKAKKTTKTTKTTKKSAGEKTKKTTSKKTDNEKTKKATKSTAKKPTKGTTRKSKSTTKK